MIRLGITTLHRRRQLMVVDMMSVSLFPVLVSSSSSFLKISNCFSSKTHQSSSLIQQDDDTTKPISTDTSSDNSSNNNKYYYGTRVFVETTPPSSSSILSSHPLTPYIQTAISRSASSSSSSSSKTTTSESPMIQKDISIVFLGTGAGGRPNTYRNPSSLALRIHGTILIIDVGEGTQKQLALSSCLDSKGYLHIEKILITHLHADHINGLPGLLLQIHDAARNRHEELFRKKQQQQQQEQRKDYWDTTSTAATENTSKYQQQKQQQQREFIYKHNIDIYGPPGLYSFLLIHMIVTKSSLRHLSITVHELIGGKEDKDHGGGVGPTKTKQSYKKNHHHNHTFTIDSSSWKHPNIHPKTILQQEEDESWMIQQQQPPLEKRTTTTTTCREDTYYTSSSTQNTFHSYTIRAGEIDHQTGIQTFGYIIQEPTPVPRIDVQKAKALGLVPSKKYRLFKQGLSVQREEDGVWIHPHQVWVDDESLSTTTTKRKRGRKIVILGDCYHVSESMMKLCQDTDVLISEATLMDLMDVSVRLFFIYL